jgi:hypothetical protein
MTTKIYNPNNMKNKYYWAIENDFDGGRSVAFYRRGCDEAIIRASAYEVIEILGRDFILKHFNVCEGTPWLSRWKRPEPHNLKVDEMFVELKEAMARENKKWFDENHLYGFFFSGANNVKEQIRLLISVWEEAGLIKEVEIGPWANYGWIIVENP